MRKHFFSNLFVLAMALCATMSLTSCSSDDDPTEGVTEGLVEETLPTQKGWSGSLENGISTYTPDDPDADYPTYYAFSFENGVCNDAVYNVICDDETEASYICNMLNNGTFDDLESDDYSYQASKASVLSQSLRQLNAFKQVALKYNKASRADMLGISCSQNGKVVFFKLNSFVGKNGETVKTAINIWSGNMDSLPESPLFGTYDSNTGTYTNNNIMGISNSKYEIHTQYDGNYVKDFTTTLTLPNASWAQLLKEVFDEQTSDYTDLFGNAPEITLEGNTVSIKALIVGDVPRETVEQYIIILDLMMNRPFVVSFF